MGVLALHACKQWGRSGQGGRSGTAILPALGSLRTKNSDTQEGELQRGSEPLEPLIECALLPFSVQLRTINGGEIGEHRRAEVSAMPNLDSWRKFGLRHLSTDDHSYHIVLCGCVSLHRLSECFSHLHRPALRSRYTPDALSHFYRAHFVSQGRCHHISAPLDWPPRCAGPRPPSVFRSELTRTLKFYISTSRDLRFTEDACPLKALSLFVPLPPSKPRKSREGTFRRRFVNTRSYDIHPL